MVERTGGIYRGIDVAPAIPILRSLPEFYQGKPSPLLTQFAHSLSRRLSARPNVESLSPIDLAKAIFHDFSMFQANLKGGGVVISNDGRKSLFGVMPQVIGTAFQDKPFVDDFGRVWAVATTALDEYTGMEDKITPRKLLEGIESHPWPVRREVNNIQDVLNFVFEDVRMRALLLDWEHFSVNGLIIEYPQLTRLLPIIALGGFPLRASSVGKKAILDRFDNNHKTMTKRSSDPELEIWLVLRSSGMTREEATFVRDFLLVRIIEAMVVSEELFAEEVMDHFTANNSYLEVIRTKVAIYNMLCLLEGDPFLF